MRRPGSAMKPGERPPGLGAIRDLMADWYESPNRRSDAHGAASQDSSSESSRKARHLLALLDQTGEGT